MAPRDAATNVPVACSEIRSRVSAMRSLHPLVGVAVVEEDRREAPERAARLPAGDLVVVDLGQLVAKAGSCASR